MPPSPAITPPPGRAATLEPVAVERLRRIGRPPLRGEADLMAPGALAALQPSALSCSHYFVERLFRDRWSIRCESLDLDAEGAGIARYGIEAGGRRFEFVALANPPVEGGRSGRVLDGERDMNGGLYEGRATDRQIETMRREMPKIYAGRAEPDTLIWCRSNRSMRVFEHVVGRLAAGRQPDPERIAEIGYLMRNVGIEGNGIYGTRPFLTYGRDHPLGAPYMAQMLAGYMMREFSFDLAEHLARVGSPGAAALDPAFKRFIGIGNGSAIGLVFFVYNRPQFLGRWLEMRERLIASAAALHLADDDPRRATLAALLERAARFVAEDRVGEDGGTANAQRSAELRALAAAFAADATLGRPVRRLLDKAWAECAGATAETVLSCVMDLMPELRDRLLACFVVDEDPPPAPRMRLGDLAGLIERQYGWALATDTETPSANHFVWYQSISNDEPRRGTRDDTPATHNMLRNVVGGVKALLADIRAFGETGDTADFLLAHPEHRHTAQRIEHLRDARFHTPHCNPFAEDFRALDLVRLIMVGFYGLAKPVDYLDRNARGIMFHGAPARGEIGRPLEPGWHLPLMPRAVP